MLGYLLDSRRDHGLGDTLLREFLTHIQSEILDPHLKKILSTPFIDVEISLEEPYSLNGARKDIDIQARFLSQDRKEQFLIIIENKLKTGAANPQQLADYYRAVIEDDNTIKNLLIVFLTPSSSPTGYVNEFENLEVHEGHSKMRVYWNEKDNNLLQMIKNILRREINAEINPVNEYMRHTLKAFVVYLEDVFANSSGKPQRRGEDIGKLVEDRTIHTKVHGECTIVLRDSGQIQVLIDKEKQVAKPILRAIINEYQLDVKLEGITTQQMGKRILDALQDKPQGF